MEGHARSGSGLAGRIRPPERERPSVEPTQTHLAPGPKMIKPALYLLLTLTAACSANSPLGEASPPPQAPATESAPRGVDQDRLVPDDPAAVAALEKLPVRLVRSYRGVVQGVEMTDPDVDDAAMAHLEGLPSLEWLKIERCEVTDAGLEHLAGLGRLRRLYLHDLAVTDAGLAQLGKLARLEVVALEKTKITGPGLRHLAGLRALRVLNLGKCKIGDDALASLKPLARLETLGLQGTTITDEGLKHLGGLKGLIVVNVNGCEVSLNGLNHLRPLINLRILRVKNTQVTSAEADEFDDAIPGLAVFD